MTTNNVTPSVSFVEAIKICIKKFFIFNGRASRKEYWYFWIFCTVLISIASSITFLQTPSYLITILTLIPLTAAATRRLHDIGKSGWWNLISLTGIGIFILLYWLCQKPKDEHNKYADNVDGSSTITKLSVITLFILFFEIIFSFKPYDIPSGSMVPTLLIGDNVFVSKLSYGLSKYTIAEGLPLFDGRIFGSPPQRGDVAVFKLPRDNRTDYVKRIVGLPGDRIQMIGGVLNINGEPVKLQRIDDVIGPDHLGHPSHLAQFLELLPSGKVYHICQENNSGPFNNTPLYVVPPHQYFVLGDNRDNSSDSRVAMSSGGVGFVPEENLIGRVDVIFLSLADGAKIWTFWRWPFDLRVTRLFQTVN